MRSACGEGRAILHSLHSSQLRAAAGGIVTGCAQAADDVSALRTQISAHYVRISVFNGHSFVRFGSVVLLNVLGCQWTY